MTTAIRNALSGFVMGSAGIVAREIHAAKEPITFTVTLIGQLALWTVMTYIFFTLTAYASNWTTADF